MYKNKTIGVVVRAHNEEKSIRKVLDCIPDFVDKIYMVNDASTDKTLEIVLQPNKRDSRVIVINHNNRQGAGAAAISGLKCALQEGVDIIAVIDGDGQMIPAILSRFLDPIVLGKADYSKGSRLSKKEHKKEMPAWRLFGNFLLTYLTRIASGYWHISDPQNGYTAISRETLKKINLDKIERGFAFENDMLIKLKMVGARIVNIPHPAVYRGENSKIRYPKFIFQTAWLLIRGFITRLWKRCFLNTEHPVVV